MRHFDDHAACLHLRVLHHLASGEHGGAGHAGVFEDGEPLFGALDEQRLLGHFQPLVGVAVAAGGGLEAFVFQPLGVVEGVAEAAPLVVAHHRDADVAAGGLVDEVDEGGGGGNVHFLADEGLAAHVRRPHEGDDGVEHGEPHVLALPGAFAREKRRRDRLRRRDAGELVRQDGADEPWPGSVGTPLHAGEARERLDDRVVDGLVGERPLLAPAAHRNVDEVRLDGLEVLVVEAEPRHDAGAEVLHEDVRRAGEIEDHLPPSGRFGVHGNRALVAVVVHERRREVALPVPGAPHMVAAQGRFHLDDVRALVGENHRAVGASDHRREIDDAHAVKRPSHAASWCLAKRATLAKERRGERQRLANCSWARVCSS